MAESPLRSITIKIIKRNELVSQAITCYSQTAFLSLHDFNLLKLASGLLCQRGYEGKLIYSSRTTKYS